jgi:hypothetical protein
MGGIGHFDDRAGGKFKRKTTEEQEIVSSLGSIRYVL